MKSRVTTKQGDSGTTRSLSGETYSKAHPIMECVGTIDELRAHTALTRLLVLECRPKDYEHLAEVLLWIIHTYFLLGSACSDPLKKQPAYHKGDISGPHIQRLEREQQDLEVQINFTKGFIASASNKMSAQCDIAATVARRLERHLVQLKETVPEFAAEDVLIYVNRLSDLLYVLARYLDGTEQIPVDYSILDQPR